MTSGTEQKLTCEGKAGNPPAKLEWYRDSTMIESQYTLEGDMVKAEVKITKIKSIFFTQFRMPLPKKGDLKYLWTIFKFIFVWKNDENENMLWVLVTFFFGIQ